MKVQYVPVLILTLSLFLSQVRCPSWAHVTPKYYSKKRYKSILNLQHTRKSFSEPHICCRFVDNLHPIFRNNVSQKKIFTKLSIITISLNRPHYFLPLIQCSKVCDILLSILLLVFFLLVYIFSELAFISCNRGCN